MRPHRNKYDRRPYWQRSAEDFVWAMQQHRNYYANKRKRTNKVIKPTKS